MEYENVKVSVNQTLAKKASKVFEQHGISLEEAIMLFLYEVDKTKSIPFELTVIRRSS